MQLPAAMPQTGGDTDLNGRVLAFKRAAVAELSSVAISWDFAIRLKFPVEIFASAYKRIDERLNSFTSGAAQEGISSCFGRQYCQLNAGQQVGQEFAR